MAPSSMRLHSAEIAGDTLESLYAVQGRQRLWIGWLVLGLMVAALLALPVIEVDIVVRAAGTVRPVVERSEVRCAIGGLVAEVKVRDNERVRRGDVLLTVASPGLDEKISAHAARSRENTDQLSDLVRLLRHAASADGCLAAKWYVVAEPVPGDRAAEAKGTQLGAEDFATAMRRQEYVQLIVQLETRDLRLLRACRELARVRALHVRGLMTDRDLDDARFNAQSAAAETMLLVRQTTARWQAELAERESLRDALLAEGRALREEKDLHTVRATAEGTLSGFAGLAAGGYVLAGQIVGALSPDEALRVDCQVLSRDVGLVRVGQPARVEIEAFPATQLGGTAGHGRFSCRRFVLSGDRPGKLSGAGGVAGQSPRPAQRGARRTSQGHECDRAPARRAEVAAQSVARGCLGLAAPVKPARPFPASAGKLNHNHNK